MVARGIATMLAALLLPAICPVAGAPMFPPGDSYYYGRPFAEASHLLNSAMHQPGHGQHGIEPVASASHDPDGQAWSNSPWSPQVLHPHVSDPFRPHNDPTLQYQNPNPPDPWAFASSPLHSDPLGSAWVEPLHQHQLGSSADGSMRHLSNYDLMDTEDMVALMDAADARMRSSPRSQVGPGRAANQASTGGSGADWTSQHAPSQQDFWNDLYLSPLRSGPSEPRQQQYLGGPAGDVSVVSDRPFASGPNEMHQRMDALGSSSSSLSSSPYPQAGPSSLPGNPLVDQARPRMAGTPRGTPRPRTEEQRQLQKAYLRGYRLRKQLREQAASIRTDRTAIAQHDVGSQSVNHPPTDYEQELLARAIPLFTLGQMGVQQPLMVRNGKGNQNSMPGYVRATTDQVLTIQEILRHRLGKFKEGWDTADQLHLKSELTYLPKKQKVQGLLSTLQGELQEKHIREMGPFQEPPQEAGYPSSRRFLSRFALGDYLIHVHKKNPAAGSHAVYAYPKAIFEKKASQGETSQPNVIFLGNLRIDKVPVHSNAAGTNTR